MILDKTHAITRIIVMLSVSLAVITSLGIYLSVWEAERVHDNRTQVLNIHMKSIHRTFSGRAVLHELGRIVQIYAAQDLVTGSVGGDTFGAALSDKAVQLIVEEMKTLQGYLGVLQQLQSNTTHSEILPTLDAILVQYDTLNTTFERWAVGDKQNALQAKDQIETMESSMQALYAQHVAALNEGIDQIFSIQKSGIPLTIAVIVLILCMGVFVSALVRGLHIFNDGRRREEKAVGMTERLGRILDNSWNEIYIFHGDTYRFLQVNRGALANIGYSMKEMERLSAYDIKPDFTRETFIEAVRSVRDGTRQFLVFESRHQRKDGTIYSVEVRLQFLPNEDPPIFVAVINDITTQKAAARKIIELNETLEQRVEQRTAQLQKEAAHRLQIQDRLRESEARTRQIVNCAMDGFVTIDEIGTIISFNTAAEKLFGYCVTEAVGENVTILMVPDNAVKCKGYLEHYLNTGHGKIIGAGREVMAKRKDGSTFLAELSVSDFSHNGTVTFVGIIRDITVRKEDEYRLKLALQDLRDTQTELVQAEKMASLGGLVAGIAHEINTPIGIGVTAASLLDEQTQDIAKKFTHGELRKSEFQAFIDMAQQSTVIISANLSRASNLIRSFKQVAVDQSSEEKRSIKLLDYVDEVLLSLQPQIKRTAHEVMIEGDREIEIETYPGVLSQIIANLVMNSLVHAYDAEDKGHISIRAEATQKTVSLIYCDDGKGMPEKVRAKVFEPFFTTKRGSGGSGLGMHILYNQITQTLGGHVTCESAPGQGTRVEITIPLHPKQENTAAGEDI